MIQVKEKDLKHLHDLELSYDGKVELTKIKKGEKISILSDSMMKTMLQNENRLKYSAKLLSYFLDVSYEELNGNKNKFVQDYLSKELGIEKIVPNCVIYQENTLSNSHLHTNRIDELQDHVFFNSLFNNIGVEPKTIQNAYHQYNKTGNIQILKKLEKDMYRLEWLEAKTKMLLI